MLNSSLQEGMVQLTVKHLYGRRLDYLTKKLRLEYQTEKLLVILQMVLLQEYQERKIIKTPN